MPTPLEGIADLHRSCLVPMLSHFLRPSSEIQRQAPPFRYILLLNGGASFSRWPPVPPLLSTPHRSGPFAPCSPCLRHPFGLLGASGEPCAEARSVLADGRQPSCFAYRLASGGGCPERRGRRSFVTRPGAQKRAVPQGDSPFPTKLRVSPTLSSSSAGPRILPIPSARCPVAESNSVRARTPPPARRSPRRKGWYHTQSGRLRPHRR